MPIKVHIGPPYQWTGTILACPPVRDRESLFIVLHELGHAFHRHQLRTWDKARSFVQMERDDLQEEVDAWRYALRCLKPEAHEVCRRFAVKKMRSYCRNVGGWVNLEKALDGTSVRECFSLEVRREAPKPRKHHR